MSANDTKGARFTKYPVGWGDGRDRVDGRDAAEGARKVQGHEGLSLQKFVNYI